MLTISVGRSAPLALACAVFLAAACSQNGSASPTAAHSPSPSPGALAQRAHDKAQASSQPIRPGSPRTPAAPRPTPSGPSLSAVYESSFQIDAQHLVAANGARVTSCVGKTQAGCRAALVQVTTSATAFQHDLDTHPAPSCLASADTILRSAISFFLQGAQLGTRGIDDSSAAELAQGNGLLDQGNARLQSASTQLGQDACIAPTPKQAP